MDRVFEAPHLIDALDGAERYNRSLLEHALAFAGSARTVLDFGAGTGRLAIALTERGFAVTCVEPDASLRSRLAARGLDAFASVGDLGERRFDYAISFNVLEHIPDDAAAVRALYQRLEPGGRCLVYVPAFRLLWTANDTRVGHVRRYGRGSLVRLFRDAGFTVQDARYADSLGFLATLVYRLAGRRDGEITPGSVRLYDRWVFPLSLGLDPLLHRVLGKNLVLSARRVGGRPSGDPAPSGRG